MTFLRNIATGNSHVLEDFHFRDKKEILEISSAAAWSMLGIRGDGAIEVQFCVSDANCREKMS
jgi:hypothetical protein